MSDPMRSFLTACALGGLWGLVVALTPLGALPLAIGAAVIGIVVGWTT